MAAEFVRIEGLEGVLNTLKSLPPEIVSRRGGPVRSALQKASKVMVTAMRNNVQKIMDEPNIGGLDEATGLLRDNIVTIRMKMGSVKGEAYKVGPRLRKKYPLKSPGAKQTSVVQIGRQLETGTERRRPMPWARPAFDAKKHTVIIFFRDELNKKLGAIVRKLARQNRVA
jgi:HK97 gp10 family phage protein